MRRACISWSSCLAVWYLRGNYMTKKEQAVVDNLKRELALARAFRRTDKVEPDVPIPTSHGTDALAKGFLYAGSLSDYPRVEIACSSAVHHAFGRDDKTTTQNATRLYSTRLLALRALRHEVENSCAQRLARVDQDIEKELTAAVGEFHHD